MVPIQIQIDGNRIPGRSKLRLRYHQPHIPSSVSVQAAPSITEKQ